MYWQLQMLKQNGAETLAKAPRVILDACFYSRYDCNNKRQRCVFSVGVMPLLCALSYETRRWFSVKGSL